MNGWGFQWFQSTDTCHLCFAWNWTQVFLHRNQALLLELQPNTCYCFPTCCNISAILKTENSPASSPEWRDCVCTHTSTRFWLSNNSSQTFVDFKRSVNIWSAFGKTFAMLQWFWCFNILCPGEEHDKYTDCELFAWHLSCSTYFNIWGHKIGRKIYHIYVDKNAI